MFQMISQGGPMTGLLVVTGLAVLAVFLERLLHLHRAQIRPDDFLRGIVNVMKRRNITEAVTLCDDTPGPVARVVRAALLHHDEGRDRIEAAMQEEGLREIPRLESRLGILALLARIAPMMGLAGTALGMMETLSAVQSGAPLIHAGDVAGGLWQALIATVTGLVVAILAHAGHSFLTYRVDGIVLDMERSAGEMLNLLARPAATPPVAGGAR
jgi:biopolymer transport protein ExbB